MCLLIIGASPLSPTTTMHPSWVVGLVSWDTEALIQEVQRLQPNRGTGPSDRLFVLDSVKSLVFQWGRAPQIACHPG